VCDCPTHGERLETLYVDLARRKAEVAGKHIIEPHGLHPGSRLQATSVWSYAIHGVLAY
jgi:hypothetical protein